MKILILEDNAERRSTMESCIRDRFHQYECVTFVDVPQMLAYLETELPNAVVISLDHDLEVPPRSNGQAVDPGTGREVVDFLLQRAPTCPVVIATTNSNAGDGMEFALREAGWTTYRVFPWGGLDWITSEWFRTVRNAIVGTARSAVKA